METVSFGESSVLLFGGYQGVEYLNDVYLSNDFGFNWQLLSSNELWTPRYGHKATFYNSFIYFCGGMDLNGNEMNDVWGFNATEILVNYINVKMIQ